jgi:uncharacterized protein YndB with AHSA1/START domain
MAFELWVSDVVPACPHDIYDAWLGGHGHEKITGGQPAQISGRNLKLEPGRRIVQSWRTTKFTEADPDSQIEVLLEPTPGGARVTVHHTNVPDGRMSYRDGGRRNSYFEPMKTHFNHGT